MKNIAIAYLTLLFCFGFIDSTAQTMSKKQEKALKKEINNYKKNPDKWVRLMNKQKKEVKNLEDEVTRLKLQLNESYTKNDEIYSELDLLQAKYESKLKEVPKNTTELPAGAVYQVQIGYYKLLNLASFNDSQKTIKAESFNGAKRYVIGYFYNVEDAVSFSNDIKKLGVKDAFVSQYIDGERNIDFDVNK